MVDLDVRDEETSSSGTSLLDGFTNVLEDREAEVSLTSLLGVCSTDDLGACLSSVSFCHMYHRDIDIAKTVPYSIAC